MRKIIFLNFILFYSFTSLATLQPEIEIVEKNKIGVTRYMIAVQPNGYSGSILGPKKDVKFAIEKLRVDSFRRQLMDFIWNQKYGAQVRVSKDCTEFVEIHLRVAKEHHKVCGSERSALSQLALKTKWFKDK